MAVIAAEVSQRPARRRWPVFPIVFYGALAALCLVWFWHASLPGGAPFDGMTLGLVGCILIGAVVWGCWLLAHIFQRVRQKPRGSALWLLVAPVGGIVFLAILYLQLPVVMRFSLDKSAFDEEVAQIHRTPHAKYGVPWKAHKVGSYVITDVQLRENGAIIMYEENGDFIDDAGFAYLPNGPYSVQGDGELGEPTIHPPPGPVVQLDRELVTRGD